jgi:surface protein
MTGVRKGKAAVSILLSMVLSFWCVPAQAFVAGNDMTGSGSAAEGSTAANAMVADADAVVALSEEATGLEAVESTDAAFEMALTEQPSEVTESSGPTSENPSSASAQVDLASSAQSQANQTETEAAAVALAASVKETTPGVLTEGWTQADTCEWKIEDGALTVRPLGNGESGVLGGKVDAWGTDFTSFALQGKVAVSDCSDLFSGCAALKTVDLAALETPVAVNASSMFFGCSLLEAAVFPSAGFKISCAAHMFQNSGKLFFLDLSGLETPAAVDADSMFSGCKSLETLALPSSDLRLSNAYQMFFYCHKLSSVNLRGLVTSAGVDFGDLFEECFSLTSVAFPPSFDALNACGMFWGCSALKSVDLTGLKAHAVPAAYMFNKCASLESVIFPESLVVSKASFMFNDCKSLEMIDLSGLETPSAINAEAMFCNCYDLKTVKLPASFKVSDIGGSNNFSQDRYGMFYGCSNLTFADLSGLETPEAVDASYLFCDCQSLKTVVMPTIFKTSKARDLFFGCSSLETIALPTTFQATGSCAEMFSGCSSIKELDLTGLTVTGSLDFMFYGMTSLDYLDISSFDTSDIDSMSSMFSGTYPTNIKVGRYFWITSYDGKEKCSFPSDPSVRIDSSEYTGKWVNSANGQVYRPDEIPNGIAATYTAQKKTIISEDMFDVDMSKTSYTGSEIIKSVTSDCLTEGVDYAVSYDNNVNAGTATITITGMGSYTGTLTYSFTINKAPASYTVPTGLTATVGQTLKDVSLPSGFSWEDPSQLVGNAGSNTFTCSYAGDANHEGASGIVVTVKVSEAKVETQTVYRMYNPITSEHLFTTDESEYQSLTKHNWKQEGGAWTAPKSGAVGVYRLYNPGLGALAKMSHHYTTDKSEAENLVRNHGWVYDFGGQPAFYSAEDSTGALDGASAVYRLYNGGLSAHHYTLDSSENSSLIKRYGWNGEGTGFYAYSAA